MKIIFSLVANPWLVFPDELVASPPFISTENLAECQLELIDLQANDVMKRQHAISESLIIFWREVHQIHLRSMAKLIFSMFGSTYCCEHTFSVRKNVKSKLRNRLSCEHTSQLIKAAVTSYEPDYFTIGAKMQAHPSH